MPAQVGITGAWQTDMGQLQIQEWSMLTARLKFKIKKTNSHTHNIISHFKEVCV